MGKGTLVRIGITEKILMLNNGDLKSGTMRVQREILRVLADADKPLSSREIAEELRKIGIYLDARTVRYHLQKLDEKGLTAKPKKYKRVITEKGREKLRRSLVYERLEEFSERVEYNIYTSTFSLDTLKGTIPTNVAIIDKEKSEKALRILSEVSHVGVSTSNLVAVYDEGEHCGELLVPEGKFVIAAVSNTLIDAILMKAGVTTKPEIASLLHISDGEPEGFSEMISYKGITLSPGWLMIKAGLTSVYKLATEGSGDVIAAVRSFSVYTLDTVKKELRRAEKAGIGGILSISPPPNHLSLPWLSTRRGEVLILAGVNYLAPLEELGLKPDIRINEYFIDFTEFRSIDNVG